MTDSGTSANAPLLPYASPTPLTVYGETFRHEAMLVVRDDATLPNFCILCGEPGTGSPLTLKFTWDSSFKVTHERSTLELRRPGSVHAFFCQKHLRRWRLGRRCGIAGMIASALVMLVSLVLAVINEASNIPLYTPHALGGLVLGFALFILFLFFFTLKTRTIACARIEQGYLHLVGCNERFLSPLPPLPVHLLQQNP